MGKERAMEAASVKANAEVEIRALIDDWANAIRAKDVDGIMARHALDLVSFDCHSALQFKGAEAYRKFLEACFPCMQGPMIFEIHELDIAAGEDVAFAHFIARCVATGLDGAEHASRLRATVGLRKTNGAWRIAHGHLSAPFDPQNGQAMLDLKLDGAA
jgi:uncharacterized protein (TIGR02246 family)